MVRTITEKQRLVVVLVALLILLVAFGLLIWRDRGRYKQAREEISSLNDRIAAHESKLAKRPELEVQRVEMERRHIRAKRELPDGPEPEEFLKMLHETKREANVQMPSARPERATRQAKKAQKVESTQWSLQITGSFFNLVTFINHLERQTRFVRIEGFSITAGTGAESNLKLMALGLSTFYYGAPTPKAAQADKAS